MEKIEKFIAQVNECGRFSLDQSPLLALEKIKYVVNGRPNWAAMLLFAEEPVRHHIHIGRFKTPSMIIDDRQFTDTLFEAVDQAMKFIVANISVGFEFDGSLQRSERFLTHYRPCGKRCSMLLSIEIIQAHLIFRLKYSMIALRFSIRENSLVA